MRLKSPGKSTSKVEVSHIDIHGIWLWIEGKEHFLSYSDYPWFKDAKLKDILNVKLFNGFHLRWPKLDVDLELESLGNQRYSLKYQ